MNQGHIFNKDPFPQNRGGLLGNAPIGFPGSSLNLPRNQLPSNLPCNPPNGTELNGFPSNGPPVPSVCNGISHLQGLHRSQSNLAVSRTVLPSNLSQTMDGLSKVGDNKLLGNLALQLQQQQQQQLLLQQQIHQKQQQLLQQQQQQRQHGKSNSGGLSGSISLVNSVVANGHSRLTVSREVSQHQHQLGAHHRVDGLSTTSPGAISSTMGQQQQTITNGSQQHSSQQQQPLHPQNSSAPLHFQQQQRLQQQQPHQLPLQPNLPSSNLQHLQQQLTLTPGNMSTTDSQLALISSILKSISSNINNNNNGNSINKINGNNNSSVGENTINDIFPGLGSNLSGVSTTSTTTTTRSPFTSSSDVQGVDRTAVVHQPPPQHGSGVLGAGPRISLSHLGILTQHPPPLLPLQRGHGDPLPSLPPITLPPPGFVPPTQLGPPPKVVNCHMPTSSSSPSSPTPRGWGRVSLSSDMLSPCCGLACSL